MLDTVQAEVGLVQHRGHRQGIVSTALEKLALMLPRLAIDMGFLLGQTPNLTPPTIVCHRSCHRRGLVDEAIGQHFGRCSSSGTLVVCQPDQQVDFEAWR